MTGPPAREERQIHSSSHGPSDSAMNKRAIAKEALSRHFELSGLSTAELTMEAARVLRIASFGGSHEQMAAHLAIVMTRLGRPFTRIQCEQAATVFLAIARGDEPT
jgi:hypothetical protein